MWLSYTCSILFLYLHSISIDIKHKNYIQQLCKSCSCFLANYFLGEMVFFLSFYSLIQWVLITTFWPAYPFYVRKLFKSSTSSLKLLGLTYFKVATEHVCIWWNGFVFLKTRDPTPFQWEINKNQWN